MLCAFLIAFIYEDRELVLKTSREALYFRFIMDIRHLKDRLLMTSITNKLDSYNIKSVEATIICYLWQLKKQQITKQNLIFLQLKGNHKLGMEK